MATSETVSAGEVCSIDIAKKYGFYDPETYYTPEYSDTRTYGRSDTPDRPARVCKQASDGSAAYPVCPIVFGIPYEQDKINPNKCVIQDCPTGLTKDQDRCTKPSNQQQTAIPVAKKTHCDEKNTDWYMLPNYHLGNKYNFISQGSNTACMKPCPVDRVPGYTEDPVDGSSGGLFTNTEITQCYTKDEYLAGKYLNTGNFCPISWVYRLGQTKEDIMNDLTDQIMKIEKENGTNMYLDRAKEIAKNRMEEIYTESKKLLENIEVPEGAMLSACGKLHTPDRVKKAYGICKGIHDAPASINKILTNKTHQKALVQSCHALFCNDADDLVSMISPGTEALCYPDPGSISGEQLLANDQQIEKKQSSKIDIGEEPTIKDSKDIEKGYKTMNRTLNLVIKILIYIPLIFMVVFFIYKLVMWIIHTKLGCNAINALLTWWHGIRGTGTGVQICTVEAKQTDS